MADDGPPTVGPDDGPDAGDRAGEALGHLQAAARELIAASRAFLDVVEELVDDPRSGDAVLEAIDDLAHRFGARGRPDDDAAGGVTHIPVE